MLLRLITCLTLVACAASCRSSGGGAASAPAFQFEKGLVALVADEGAPGGEAKLRVRSAKGVERLNVIIAQLDYDSARMRLKSCDIAPGVAEGTAAGKQLLSLEQAPGRVRAIVTGSVEPLPGDADIFACSFAIAADAPAGSIQVRVEGDASDTDFVDHAFREEVSLVVRN